VWGYLIVDYARRRCAGADIRKSIHSARDLEVPDGRGVSRWHRTTRNLVIVRCCQRSVAGKRVCDRSPSRRSVGVIDLHKVDVMRRPSRAYLGDRQWHIEIIVVAYTA